MIHTPENLRDMRLKKPVDLWREWDIKNKTEARTKLKYLLQKAPCPLLWGACQRHTQLRVLMRPTTSSISSAPWRLAKKLQNHCWESGIDKQNSFKEFCRPNRKTEGHRLQKLEDGTFWHCPTLSAYQWRGISTSRKNGRCDGWGQSSNVEGWLHETRLLVRQV